MLLLKVVQYVAAPASSFFSFGSWGSKVSKSAWDSVSLSMSIGGGVAILCLL